jgi:hypothetical protein
VVQQQIIVERYFVVTSVKSQQQNVSLVEVMKQYNILKAILLV